MRKILTATAVFAIAGGIALGLAPAANAATGCYAAGCTGKDPVQMGCNNDATTLDTVSTGEGDVDLRWSNACQANWARIRNVPISGTNFWVVNKAGNKQSYGWGWFGAASGWSNMVNGHDILAQACDDDGCTGWH